MRPRPAAYRGTDGRFVTFAADRHGVDDLPTMLTPAEVAVLLGVNAKTVTRWAVEGRLPAVRTPGGHRRYRLAAVLALLCAAGFSDVEAASAVRAFR